MNFGLIFTFLVLISSSNSAWLDRRSESYECINVTSDIFKPLEPLSPTDGPVTRCYNLELVLTDLAPDGFTRPVWTANGQYPGPILQANHGDRMIVNVFNKFGDPATIHWHGMFQKGTNFYDGPEGITQCAIPNDDKFTYNFTIKQNGTYWYHSHHLGQMIDGLKGPLIIYNPKDPYLGKYDFEYVMTLSDWYHAPTSILLPIFSSDSYRGFAPVPDSGEISGLGQYDCKAVPKNSTCNPNNKIATYVVKKGKKYRFRIINTSALVHYILSIDNHPLTIIEVDGTLVKPVTLNTIPINIAQRYSVILDANQEIDNYQIRAHITDCTAIDNKTLNFDSAINYDVTGILKYDGAKDKPPTSNPYHLNTSEECSDVNPNFLKPYVEQKVPQNVIATFKALVNFGAAASGRGIALINNSSFVPSDNYPTNQKIVDGIKPDELSNTDNPYTYECDSGDCDDAAVEIFIINNTTDSHPFHVHGHDFFVLYNGENNSDIKSPQKSEFNFKDPVIRDVVTVLPNSTTVILYSANNPGVWLFHCHIQWHLSMGMAAQLIESPSIFKNTIIPSDVTALCAKDRG
ncbi:extracellular dihydrogeodin oxidase/laccase [Gigaspora margarita]|uniref:Extracellular dihydrogeodin oxidase/laccase n=1 Tax=Gigaspora margarita TaxID=4874 RepID=A0A8H4A197_GIGMA|nr:extracellular dihydrogeodin oxidase/laccase [Gigaspora margarita]